MTFVDLRYNRLCGQYFDGSGPIVGTYDATGIKAIADALSVSSSLTSLK